jgi:hypothetical protein
MRLKLTKAITLEEALYKQKIRPYEKLIKIINKRIILELDEDGAVITHKDFARRDIHVSKEEIAIIKNIYTKSGWRVEYDEDSDDCFVWCLRFKIKNKSK